MGKFHLSITEKSKTHILSSAKRFNICDKSGQIDTNMSHIIKSSIRVKPNRLDYLERGMLMFDGIFDFEGGVKICSPYSWENWKSAKYWLSKD